MKKLIAENNGRVVAIYHKETRKVLGRVPVRAILKQTRGYHPKYRVAVREFLYAWGGGMYVYDVVHGKGGLPIKVIADSQKEADTLIASLRPTPSQHIANILNAPNPIMEDLKWRK